MDQIDSDSPPAVIEDIATVPNSPVAETLRCPRELKAQQEDVGLIGELHAVNRDARAAFRRLADRRQVEFYKYHSGFMRIIPNEDPKLVEPVVVFSLSNLPEFARLGWRIGRGRTMLDNLGVDVLLLVMGEESGDIAGTHARFAWVRGAGGFFLIADNLRGKTVTLNGEVLKNEQRLIPYRNIIGIGECYFTLKFPTRTAEQDEQFHIELAAFYTYVLRDSVPLVVPTPSMHVVTVGDWVVRSAIRKEASGHVYAVTNSRTGKVAAAKELWRTKHNSHKVDEEVAMAKRLKVIKHKHLATPFEFRHEAVHDEVEKERIMKLLDDTWKPESSNDVDKYTIFSPLCSSTFYSLFSSRAATETGTYLYAQILEGVAFLHENGITHGDIKPASLLVCSYDPPLAKIIDFGCARTGKKILYDRPETTPYLAPEQRKGQHHGHYVDYWACALVAADILGYERSNTQVDEKDFHKIHFWLGGQLYLPIVTCCMAMLQWKPEDRMTADKALENPLASYRETSAMNQRMLE